MPFDSMTRNSPFIPSGAGISSGCLCVSFLAVLFAVLWFAEPSASEAGQPKGRGHTVTSSKHKVPKARAHKPKVRKKKSPGLHKRAPKVVMAKAFYCENLSRNQTLLSRNPDKQLPVASLTKLVTALVTLEHLPLGRTLTVPDDIKKVPKSVVGLKPGDKVSVRELLHGLLISSGNDCAETLACGFPGGKAKFVRAMNDKAKSLGTNRTHFYTPSGLDKKVGQAKDGEDVVDVESNVSTAREIAKIARVAFSDARIRTICRKKAHVLASEANKGGYPVRTTNKLLRDNLPVIGGKTGYTSRAGHCIATELAPRKDDLFMIVVLGSPNHFRDARLVYRKALRETGKTRTASPGRRNPARIASHYGLALSR